MRDFQALLKEAKFYAEIDKSIPSGKTLENWFADLPKEEKEILRSGLSEMVSNLVSMFDGKKFFENLKSGIIK